MIVQALTAMVVTTSVVTGIVWCLPCKLTLMLGKSK
jgi:hypothetical protein